MSLEQRTTREQALQIAPWPREEWLKTHSISAGLGPEKDAEVFVVISLGGELLAVQAKIDENIYTALELASASSHNLGIEEGAQSFNLHRHDVRLNAHSIHHSYWGGFESMKAIPAESLRGVRILQRASSGAPSREGFVDRCLRDLDRDAEQEGIDIASEVRAEAARILRELTELPEDTDVYANDGGRVTIELPRGGFSLDCEPGGEALCLVVVNGVSRRAKYRDSGILPDGFLKEGLRDALYSA